MEHLPGVQNRIADVLSRLKARGGDQRLEPEDVDVSTPPHAQTLCIDIPILSVETAE